MAQIIGLDEILGEDIVFDYHGVRFTFPADVGTELVWKLGDLYSKLTEQETKINVKEAEGKAHVAETSAYRVTVTDTEAALLEGFRVNHPDLENLPFGAGGFMVVLAHVLAKLGFLSTPDPPKGSPAMTIPRSRKRSKPSNSSRNSSKSSASRRTSGVI
jgi:hypothetical protein